MRLYLALALATALTCRAFALDLSHATVQASPEAATAATVLIEECERRTGLRLDRGGAGQPNIRISVQKGIVAAEGFHLATTESGITIAGADARGALYGVGYLLRQLEWSAGKLAVPSGIEIATAPKYKIRGHQLGYRSTANSWDAWTIAQYDRYIRELALFGVNAIENIPFQDGRKNPLMKVARPEMNRAMAAICRRYGIDYWVWTPATIDLNDAAARAQLLEQFDGLFRDIPDLAGVFVPGGDPGNNPPETLLPFLEDLGKRSPGAKIWLSMQGFHGAKAEAVYQWANRDPSRPWFGGIVAGPSSPPAASTRLRLPANAGLRLYPDLTHNKISQFEVPEWDQAYALTLGREAINPRPYEYAAIFRRIAPGTDGFFSYSDGVHDDVNKTIWNALSWDPSANVRQVLVEYCRLHFGPQVAEEGADGILALERNWRGSLEANGGVEATLRYWQGLEKRGVDAGNWRWQMCLLRANYDAYVRRRSMQDAALELEANAILAQAKDAETAMTAAMKVLLRQPVAADLRARIIELCEQLFQSIGLQTSVEKYHASGYERGAVLDFIDNPLNNRWWLEDEFAKVRKMASESAKLARLVEIAKWENPGPGSSYDAVGNLNKAPHAAPSRGGGNEDDDTEPLFWWWDNGKSRARLTWQATRWPSSMIYEGLDPKATYVIRTQGYGQCLLRIDGERVPPAIDGKEISEFKEFPVPAKFLADGKLVLTFDRPTDEGHLNWRRKSRLAEVWLLKR